MTHNRSIITRTLSKWKLSSVVGYHELNPSPPPLPLTRKRRSSINNKARDLSFRGVSPCKCKDSVPVLAGKEGHDAKIFLLDRHILDHWLFQELLRKTCVRSTWLQSCWEEKKDGFPCSARVNKCDCVIPIFLDCDAILFEFFLWLVEKDDPSLRDLNLNDLMEFYAAEA